MGITHKSFLIGIKYTPINTTTPMPMYISSFMKSLWEISFTKKRLIKIKGRRRRINKKSNFLNYTAP
jgi:hypothetical protein